MLQLPPNTNLLDKVRRVPFSLLSSYNQVDMRHIVIFHSWLCERESKRVTRQQNDLRLMDCQLARASWLVKLRMNVKNNGLHSCSHISYKDRETWKASSSNMLTASLVGTLQSSSYCQTSLPGVHHKNESQTNKVTLSDVTTRSENKNESQTNTAA